jgi:hypothetical protein
VAFCCLSGFIPACLAQSGGLLFCSGLAVRNQCGCLKRLSRCTLAGTEAYIGYRPHYLMQLKLFRASSGLLARSTYQMPQASSSIMPIPITSTASATGS